MKTISQYLNPILLLLALALPFNLYAEKTYTFCGSSSPPFIYTEDGQFDKIKGGLTVEYFKELSNRIEGVTLKMVRLPFKRCLKFVEQGKMDGTWSAGYYKVREKYMTYLNYDLIRFPILAHYSKTRNPNGVTWNSVDDLTKYHIGKSIGANILRNALILGPNDDPKEMAKKLNISPTKTHSQSLEKAAKGRIDLIFLNPISGSELIKNLGLKEKIGVQLRPALKWTAYRSAVSKRSEAIKILPQMNAALKSMKEDGTMKKIFADYAEFIE